MFSKEDLRTAFRQGYWAGAAMENEEITSADVTLEAIRELNRMFDEEWFPHFCIQELGASSLD